MDKQTIEIYDHQAENIAKLHASLIPSRLYELIEQFFIKSGVTVDIGCGIGRDSFYLKNKGFDVIGVDASIGMLEQAKQLYLAINFIQDSLPELANFEAGKFQNILCSAVLMHLNDDLIKKSCFRLLELLKTNGRLIISFRGTNESDKRESGKLYEFINIKEFSDFFIKNNCEILLYESEIEKKRQLTWHNFVFQKN